MSATSAKKDAREIASELASRVAGTVVAIDVGEHERAFAIVIPDGRMPALVRGFPAATGIAVQGLWSHLGKVGALKPSVADDAERAIRDFASRAPSDAVSMIESAHRLRLHLDAAFDARFTVSFPGVPDPTECWLHPADHDEASVGVFVGRAIVWLDGEARTIPFERRDQLASALVEVEQGVAEQRARHREHVDSSARVRELALCLASRLGDGLGRQFETRVDFRPSHAGAVRATLVEAATRRAVAEVRASRSRVFVRSGELAHGADETDADAVDPEFDAIAARVRDALAGLSLRDLVPARVYRVRESIGSLRVAEVVRFVRFEDIDNHYGAYVFVDVDGTELAVPGDYSSPQHHAFYDTGRYLEPTDER